MSQATAHSLIVDILSGVVREEVKTFLVDCQARGLSVRTVEYYEWELTRFAVWLLKQGVSLTSDIRPEHLRAYMRESAQNRTPGGVHSAYRSIRVWLNWWKNETEHPGWQNPIAKVKAPKVTHQPNPGVSLEDIQKMIATCGQDPFGKRDRVLMMALLDNRARATEFVHLRVDDLDLRTGAILIRHGKRNIARTVYVGRKTLREVVLFLRTRPSSPLYKKIQPTDPLFPNAQGWSLTRSGLQQILERRAKLAGVPVPSPHDF